MVRKPYHHAPGEVFLTNLLGFRAWNDEVKFQERVEKLFGLDSGMVRRPKLDIFTKLPGRGPEHIRIARYPRMHYGYPSNAQIRNYVDPHSYYSGFPGGTYGDGQRTHDSSNHGISQLEHEISRLQDRLSQKDRDNRRLRNERDDERREKDNARHIAEQRKDIIARLKKKLRNDSYDSDRSWSSRRSPSSRGSRASYSGSRGGSNW